MVNVDVVGGYLYQGACGKAANEAETMSWEGSKTTPEQEQSTARMEKNSMYDLHHIAVVNAKVDDIFKLTLTGPLYQPVAECTYLSPRRYDHLPQQGVS